MPHISNYANKIWVHFNFLHLYFHSMYIYIYIKGAMKDSDDDKENDRLKEEQMDTYPVDESANYAIIAQHFQSGVTHHSNIDHSVPDFDDLKKSSVE